MSNIGIKGEASLADISEIRKAAKNLGVEIEVGFFSGEMHTPADHRKSRNKNKDLSPLKEMETAELARILHCGAKNIPARPFLEEGIKSKEDEIYTALGQEVDKAMRKESPNWDKVGTMAVGAVNEFVRDDYYKANVPNAPRTKAMKGNDTPLIDSGALIQSLHYVVKEG